MTDPNPTPDDYRQFQPIRIGDAAKILGVTEDHLRDLSDQARVPCTRTPGGHRLYDPRVLTLIRSEGLDAWEKRILREATRLQPSVPDAAGNYPEVEIPAGSEWAQKKMDLLKRVDITIASPLFVVDTGQIVDAGFGTLEPRSDMDGRPGLYNCRPMSPKAGRFSLMTESTTEATVRDITLIMDPLILSPAWDDEFVELATRSYTECLTALLAGVLTIDSLPFATVLPVNRLRVLSPLNDIPEKVLSINRDLNPGPLVREGQVDLPKSTSWQVFINSLTRSINDKPYKSPCVLWDPFVFCWTGMIQITQQNRTNMGSLSIGH